jgi:NAD(P)-dependent dehydrogenase (short-subunit alcohol dehydrogenase family)
MKEPRSWFRTSIPVRIPHPPSIIPSRSLTNNRRPYTEKAEAVAKAINESGGSAVAIPGDMLDSAYIDTLVKKAAEFGNGKIHIIVNNAGFTWDGVIHKVRLQFTQGNPIPV